ncbi:AsmA family protein [Marinobacter oulmenensis]|uniref:AsmA protein n=1 Tax=Marinobacter oulmenensis TaxID=643747 RepID=A0A840UGS3_9GAMM|nr:AsmA family protein [Marinobacter oulmenensis]MBB5319977.1 AsmA protein [Marinobacter oulmenensis]
MKAVRYLVYAVLALIALAVIAVGVAVAVINPNDYKPQIEAAVEKQTNLDLVLAGDISWSFIPLGLELNQVEAKLEDKRFVALEQLIAELDFWSLVSMTPQVNTFLLNGLEVNLEANEQGEGNWTRIMKEGQTDTQNTGQPGASDPGQDTGAGTAGGDPLNFNVESVEISNANVHYTDRSTGQSVTLENFGASASNITLGSEFPLSIRFRVETAQPAMTVDGTIDARLSANEALNEFAVSGLEAVFDLAGEPFGDKSPRAELTGSLNANLEQETADLKGFSASLANLNANADLSVKGFGDSPSISGKLEIPEFSLKALLDNLGQPAIETDDPDVLEAISFNANLGGDPGVVALSGLTIGLDDTTFNGEGSYTLANGGLVFDLQGDNLNADRYLPPAPENGDTSSGDSAPETAGNGQQPETDLLPLETVRGLVLDVDFGLGQLIVSNLTINEVTASVVAENGVLKLDEFSGKLYDGGFGAAATLDARSDNPKWRMNADVTNVQTLPLLTDLAEVDMLGGGANLKMNVTSSGNRISALRNNADGQITFNLAEGEFRRMNLTRMACQGIALANQEQLTTSDWGTTTPFNDMSGTLDINGNILNNRNLTAALAGMRLEGEGEVDLQKSTVDYEVGLRIVGEIHRDEACRVTEYVENVVIPVECRGNFAEEPGKLCSFDGSRFRDTLKDIATNAAKAKVKREAEDKVKEKLQEKLGDEAGKKVQDALKGLFK